MGPQVLDAIINCGWSPSKFLIFSGNVFEPLIYYSHLGVLLVALFFGFFIFFNNPKQLLNRLLFYMSLTISLWLFSDLVLWASEHISYVMFFWALEIIFEPIIYIIALFFFYQLIDKNVPLKIRVACYALMLPTLSLVATNFGLTGFDLTNCDRVAIEGLLPKYGYFIEILIVFWILFVAFNRYYKSRDNQTKKTILFSATGICLFLFSFSLGNISEVITENWYIGQIGYIGIPIFVGLLSYLIVRFQTFNIKIIGSQVLVAAIWFLTLSILFIRTIENVRVVIAVTLFLFSVLGIFLIRSVKKEVQQREEIAKLARDLQTANDSQAELIRFVTHQVKGYFTKSRSIFSTMLEGDYGNILDGMRPLVEEGLRSDTKGVEAVQQILEAANIRKGTIIYEKKEFDFGSLVKEEAEKLSSAALAKGLEFNLNIGEGDWKIVGDASQMSHAVRNLIDNAIKYTPHGSIIIWLRRKNDKMLLEVKDTGVGIDEEDRKKLFTEGGKGKNSLKINVDSTGFGLYIVKNIAEIHGGSVSAFSEGVGKGATFTIALPSAH